MAIDARTGTTHPRSLAARPGAGHRPHTHGVDEWLTLIAAGQAVGMASAATPARTRDPASPTAAAPGTRVGVWLAWWRDDPPNGVGSVVRTVRDAYAGSYRAGPEPPSSGLSGPSS